MSMKEAPWTPDEVMSLTDFQNMGHFHEFTCASRGDGQHRGGGALVATVRGWICPYCDYTQNWAHDFMCNGAHRESARVNMEFLQGRKK